MSPSEFLSSIWGADPQGNLSQVHFITEKTPSGMIHHPVATVAVALAIAARISAAGRDVYFACAAFKTSANRKADNAAGAHDFWLDVDCSAEKAAKNEGYLTKRDAPVALRGFCGTIGICLPSIVVDSGNGLHCYWHFDAFIGAAQWRKMARKLKSLAAKHGLRADPARTADIASVLRVPGTSNWKDPKNPKQVTIKKSSAVRDFHKFATALDQAEPDLENNSGASNQADGNFPPSSAVEIIKRCPTLAEIARVRGAVNEPIWRNMLGVIKYTSEGDVLCHEWSKGDPRYDADETQGKIDRWTKGPTICDSFRASSGAKCHGCTQTCKSPIQLGWSQNVGAEDAALHAMNFRYFVARIGGQVFVFDNQDGSILAGGMTFNAFGQFKAGQKVEGNSIARVWLKSPLRRTYGSLVFDPSGNAAEDAYNTWKGLAIQPRRGTRRRILAHIRDVWCNHNSAQFKYVLRWMALLVQQPWIKPEVALVLRSREGIGKGIISQMLLDFFGIHGFTAASKKQVLGDFNGHLFDKVLVVLEEAFFAGDPAAVAQAKVLVTNRTLGYEAKGKDAFSAPNYAHVISLTNNDWAVPAGEDARRWMVLDISEARKGDHPYFEALSEEIKNGGAEAFLHFLMNIDLTGFNPRLLPATKGLHSQRVQTLEQSDPVASFLLHTLSEGEFTLQGGAIAWAAEISAKDMQDSYLMATARARHPPTFDVAAKKLRKLLPPGALAKVRRCVYGGREFYYQLPDLQAARQHFEAMTGIDPCAP